MNAAELLLAAADRARPQDGWGPGIADWFDSIREPVGRRQIAGDDEVRYALVVARGLMGVGL